jgi:hypothetical protein
MQQGQQVTSNQKLHPLGSSYAALRQHVAVTNKEIRGIAAYLLQFDAADKPLFFQRKIQVTELTAACLCSS